MSAQVIDAPVSGVAPDGPQPETLMETAFRAVADAKVKVAATRSDGNAPMFDVIGVALDALGVRLSEPPQKTREHTLWVWVNKKAGNRKLLRRNPDATVYSRQFRAWLVPGQDPKALQEFDRLQAAFEARWAVIGRSFDLLRHRVEVDTEAESAKLLHLHGLKLQTERTKKKHATTPSNGIVPLSVSPSSKSATALALAAGLRIAKPDMERIYADINAYAKDGWLKDWDDPKIVAAYPLPEFLSNNGKNRMRRVLKGRRTRKLRGTAGYPTAMRNAGSFTVERYWNGANIENDTAAFLPQGKQAYARLGATVQPANHHPRVCRSPLSAKAARELRRVELRAGQEFLAFDVLITAGGLIPDRLKGHSITRRVVRGETVWYVQFVAEKLLPAYENESIEKARVAAIDVNWREDRDETGAIKTIDFGSDDPSVTFEQFTVKRTENRRARCPSPKLAAQDPRLQFSTVDVVPLQKMISARVQHLKGVVKAPKKAGKRYLRKCLYDPRIPAGALEQLKEGLAWIWRAEEVLRDEHRTITANLVRRQREIAKDIVRLCQKHGITDLGIPVDDYAGMSQKKDPAAPRARQETAPARQVEIIIWELKKAGIRVHRFAPAYTSQRCPACSAHTPSRQEWFSCSGCGALLHRGRIAVYHGAQITRECLRGDGTARECSRGSKLPDLVGLTPKGGESVTVPELVVAA